MADDLRGKWKETGLGLGHAFRDLGKAIIKSGATAVKKADSWANSEDYVDEKTEPVKEITATETVAIESEKKEEKAE